jgi:hypothetical protein
MPTLYCLRGQRLGAQVVHDLEDLSDEAVWIDLLAPTPEERTWVSQRYGQELPSQDAVEEIEVSSRFFVDDQGLHLCLFFPYEFPDRPRNITWPFSSTRGACAPCGGRNWRPSMCSRPCGGLGRPGRGCSGHMLVSGIAPYLLFKPKGWL